MRKILLLSIIFILSGLFRPVFGAEMSVFSEAKRVGLGELKIDVLLDTQGEAVNAVEGTLVFPQNFLALSRISDGDSAVNFWLQKPKLESGGRLTFSGIIPGGWNGKGKVFSAVFRALEEGDVSVELSNLKVFLNDGEGTAAKVEMNPYEFTIDREAETGGLETATAKDIEPPEFFSISLMKEESVFDGKWFVVFGTQDKQSGVDHFEVAERKPGFLGFGKPSAREWVFAESPYVLKDQGLKNDIWVKAVDGAKNERIAFLSAPGAVRWYKNLLIWVIILGALVLCWIIVKRNHGNKKKKSRGRRS
jgi:hypothetical protein